MTAQNTPATPQWALDAAKLIQRINANGEWSRTKGPTEHMADAIWQTYCKTAPAKPEGAVREYRALAPDYFIQPYPHTWPIKLFVRNGTNDKELPGFREFTGPGGHSASEYGYTIYYRATDTGLITPAPSPGSVAQGGDKIGEGGFGNL